MAWRGGQTYSQDLRDRVLGAETLTARQAAERFGVSVSYVVKARQRLARAGSATPRPQKPATARAYATGPDSPYRFYYSQMLTKMRASGRLGLFKTGREQPDEAVTLDGICQALVIHGTAEQVVEQILAFRETTGEFGTLLYAGHDWRDRVLARRSMVLMAERVLPAINAAIGQPSSAGT